VSSVRDVLVAGSLLPRAPHAPAHLDPIEMRVIQIRLLVVPCCQDGSRKPSGQAAAE
jgi:hypothetical protein